MGKLGMSKSGGRSIRQVTHLPTYQLSPVILFDGVCNLCNGFVQFVIARDPAGRFQFAALQSDSARRLLARLDRFGGVPDSVVLVDGGRVYTRSSAALRIARGLRFPWPLARALMIVPRPLRDWVYDLVARHRYRWFGRKDVCMTPTTAMRARFLE
jgi:predicted DCC family thiol-disulfide oxidoreductase YuxK